MKIEKEVIESLLSQKLKESLSEIKINLEEDHFSEKELESLLDRFEKEMNQDAAKAVQDYLQAEADGNKGKAAKAAGIIKRAMK